MKKVVKLEWNVQILPTLSFLSLSLSLKAEDVFKDTNTHSTIPVLKRYGPIDGVEVGSIGYSDGKICYNLQQSRIIIC